MKIVIIKQIGEYLFEGDESDAGSTSAKRLIARKIAKDAKDVDADELKKLKNAGAKARESAEKAKKAKIENAKEKAKDLKEA
jgi:hypothetical protein